MPRKSKPLPAINHALMLEAKIKSRKSYKQLERETGISEMHIRNLLYGYAKPSFQRIAVYAKTMGLELNDLILWGEYD